MPSLQITAQAVLPTDSLMSHVTDLALLRAGGREVLVATTRADGALTAWDIGAALPRRVDSTALGPADAAGAQATLTPLTIGGAPWILTGGGVSAALALHPVAADGTLGAPRLLGAVPQLGGDLINPVALATAQGGYVIYGGVEGQSGLARVILDATGRLVSAGRLADTGQIHTEAVTATLFAEAGGARYLLAVSRDNPGLSLWLAGSNGALSHRDNLTPAEGLWIAEPTALASATLDGRGFVFVAAAGSNSLTAVEIGANGQLLWRDHLIDDLGSRFAGATAMTALVHQGAVHVVIGGADDGISLFRLLPEGRLVGRGHVADQAGASLANISAITARSVGDRIDIFVASSLEPGVTRLSYHCPPEDQVLRDSAGQTRLTGGPGADLFVLGRDGVADVIADFQPGLDRIDLSLWPGLRSLGQLTITATATGASIAYGPERLTLITADGRPLAPGALTAADLLGDSHVPLQPETPWPGPGPRDPPPTTTLQGGDSADVITGGRRTETLLGGAGNDRLDGGGGADRLWGEAGADRLWGGAGRDALRGGAGNDLLEGGAGRDRLAGLGGDDRLWGGAEADRLAGGTGADRLWGGDGDDRLTGRGGADQLDGGPGRDGLRGGAGADTLMGGEGGDRLSGGGGADRLLGGAGNDRLMGRDGADVLGGEAGDDRFWGGTGADSLWGGDGADTLTGEAGADRLAGGAGADWLRGGSGRDRIEGGQGHDRLWGGAGTDSFVFAGGRDRIVDWEPGETLLIGPGLSARREADWLVDRYGRRDGDDLVLDFGQDLLRIEDAGRLGLIVRAIDFL